MIYKAFEQADIVAGRAVKVSTGFFEGGTLFASQSLFVTSSTQATISGSNRYDVYNGYYYLDVFPSSAQSSSADQIFSIAYGNVNGYGTSYDEYTNIQVRPTKSVFKQYVNSLNNGETFSVKTQTGVGGTISSVSLSTDFVALSFNSQKTKDTLDPGQFQLTLTNDAAGKCWRIIDDSTLNSGSLDVYNLILGEYDANGNVKYWNPSANPTGSLDFSGDYTGSLSQTQYFPSYTLASGTTTGGIGLFYPKTGTIIFNPDFLALVSQYTSNMANTIPVLSAASNYRITSPSSGDPNRPTVRAVYNMVQGVGTNTDEQMRIRRSEYVPSRHYFIRVKNREFNYSNNPTFSYQSSQTDANSVFHQKGDIVQQEFLTDPKVYPTSVGLYNSNNELVAVAKLSRPSQKTFTNELLIKVRLDF
jgi:hypothetical protein